MPRNGRLSSLRTLGAEMIFAMRRLAADRWAAGAAILAVAIGAGLNTAVFAAAYGILLRPLPYADPSRLVVMTIENRVHTFIEGARLDEIEDWRHNLRSVAGLAAYAPADVVVRGAGEPRLAPATWVSHNFFDVLGAPVLRGRLFSERDGPSAAAVAVVSESFARRAYGDPTLALGRTLTINRTALAIVAIVARDAAFPSDAVDVWIPVSAVDNAPRYFTSIARLAPGVTAAQARDELQRLHDAREAAKPKPKDEGPPRRGPELEGIAVASAVPIQESLTRAVRPVLWTFAAGAAIVLLIACANVATILVGRAIARQRAFAIQRALGATAWQLAISMLAESLVIAIAGSLAGLAIAAIAVRLLRVLGAGLVARVGDVAIDWPVFAFACLLSLLVSVLAAIVPARRGLAANVVSLRATSVSPGRAARRARAMLTVSQVALAVVVLAGGALLVQTVVKLLSSDIGIDSRGTVAMRLMMTDTRGFRAGDRAPLIDDLVRRVRALPGVQQAGLGSNLPPAREQAQMLIRMVQDSRDETLRLSLVAVTPGYLPALGVSLLHGRFFEESDAANPSSVVVLSEAAALHMFGPKNGTNVIGKTLAVTLPMAPPKSRATVIGVVRNVKYYGLEQPAGASIYVPWQALPAAEIFLAARTTTDPIAMAGTLRRVVRELDPMLPVVDSQPLDAVIEKTIADRRQRALLGGSIAMLAFAVALVGLAGGLLHAVTERRRELAIRAAMGATPRRAIGMILGQGAILTAIGLVLGLLTALGVGRTLSGLLYGVTPSDPSTLAMVAALVAIAALTTCYLPARRAAKADPLELLRAE